MKTFKKFLEECETINEAEFNKEWWDSKSDSFKKRYIERHPNSIYAQKAGISSGTKPIEKTTKSQTKQNSSKEEPKKKESQREIQLRARDPKTSVEELNKLADTQKSAWVNWSIAENPNATPGILDKIANRLLNMGENNQSRWSDAWYGAIETIANHKNAPKELIKKFENGDSSAQFAILSSPKVSKEFLDNQAKTLDPVFDYTWMDKLIENPNLTPEQKNMIKQNAKKAKEYLKTVKDGDWLKKPGKSYVNVMDSHLRKSKNEFLDQLINEL